MQSLQPVRSNFTRAAQFPTRHALTQHGILEYKQPLPNGPHPGFKASPPFQTRPNSVHKLLSPRGSELEFIWIASEKAWARDGGKRLAFTAEYLSSHGWQYIGKAE